MPRKKEKGGRRRAGKQAERRKLPENVTDRMHTSHGERTKEVAP
jgi:hypothetical protein